MSYLKIYPKRIFATLNPVEESKDSELPLVDVFFDDIYFDMTWHDRAGAGHIESTKVIEINL